MWIERQDQSLQELGADDEIVTQTEAGLCLENDHLKTHP